MSKRVGYRKTPVRQKNGGQPRPALNGSFVQIPIEVLTSPDISADQLRAWGFIKGHCIEEDFCRPSRRRLAKLLGISPRWTTVLLMDMQEKKYLEIIPRRGKSNLYRPVTPNGHVNAPPVPLAPPSGNGDQQAKKPLRKPADPAPPTPNSSSPNSQVYDFFCQERGNKFGDPHWKPETGAEAKRLRTNINTLLEKRSAETLVAWLTNFFADMRLARDLWPWGFFMHDPSRWSQRAGGPIVGRTQANWREA